LKKEADITDNQSPKVETPEQMMQEDLESLHNTAMQLGYNVFEVQKFCDKRKEFLERCLHQGDPSVNTQIIKMYPKKDIPGYETADVDVKLKMLHFLGINTNEPVWENVYIRQQGTKKVIDIYVCGNERLDTPWLNARVGGKRVASEEARVRGKRDKSLSKELNQLSNSSRFI